MATPRMAATPSMRSQSGFGSAARITSAPPTGSGWRLRPARMSPGQMRVGRTPGMGSSSRMTSLVSRMGVAPLGAVWRPTVIPSMAVTSMMAAASMTSSAGGLATRDRLVWSETFISVRFVWILGGFVDI